MVEEERFGATDELPRSTRAYRSTLPPRRVDPPPASSGSVPVAPRRRPRAVRLLRGLAVVCSVSVLAVSGGGYALVNHYDGNIDRIAIPATTAADRPPAAPRDAENFLLVGSDSRGDLPAGVGSQGSGSTFVSGQRSDTVILVHLYGGRSDQAQVLSFPRDSWVTIPSHLGASGTVVPASHGKLNSAFALGGPSLLIETIQGLSGIRVDHYLQIDFAGFTGMVNALGGIDVCLPRPAKEHDSGIDLPAGHSHVMGDQALAFVRQRKLLPHGDLDRIARQQQFLGAVIRKVLTAGTLLNPLRLNGFLKTATSSLKGDQDLSVADLRDLALRFRGFSAGGVVFSTLPVADVNGREKDAAGLYESVVLLDEAKAAQVFTSLRDDVPPGTPAPRATPTAGPKLVVAPARVRVEVANGAGLPGLGRRAASDLTAQGFRVVGSPGNAGAGAVASVVHYGPDRGDSARTLAAAVPGAVLQPDPSLGGTLRLVVGTSYTGARAVTVSSPAPSPRASSSAAPELQTAATDPCAV